VLIGVIVVVAVVAVAFIMFRKKRAAPVEPTAESRVETPTEAAAAKEAGAARTDEDGSKVVSVGGQTVRTFQPGGSGVAIFRPGEGSKTKVFRPGGVEEPSVSTPSTEAEEKIFRPEARDTEDGETAEGPVVQEEAVRERVVEYSDDKTLEEEETPQMPGARPAEEEIEEVEGKKPIPKPKEAESRSAEPKKEEESLDDLMKELDK
jgi:hypothetical protein